MHPLSLFPQLYYLTPLAYTLLRVAVAVVFFYLAYYYFNERERLARVHVPIVGRALWLPVFASVCFAALGLALFVGFYTQLAAILGAIAAAKFLIWKRWCGELVPFTYIASMLVLVICLALIMTGAGAFAFDLPL
jgi:hypothetical protein